MSISSEQRRIIEAFNKKFQQGIGLLKNSSVLENIDYARGAANFFRQHQADLDLGSVGDYLSGPEEENRAVLEAFTAMFHFQHLDFTAGLRSFLKAFKLPGEAQKIDRILESFANAYAKQHTETLSSNDAWSILAFLTVMLNTSLHNSNLKQKDRMDLPLFISHMRSYPKSDTFWEAFTDDFLTVIYLEIKRQPLEYNFVKMNPGYEISSHRINNDPFFQQIDLLLQSAQQKVALDLAGIGLVAAQVDMPKSWLSFFMGYQGTVTLSDATTDSKLVSIQVYIPNIFSQWLFGDKPKLIIQPANVDGNVVSQAALTLAAKIAASFQLDANIQATYDYLKTDLTVAYQQEKIPTPSESLPVGLNRFSSFSGEHAGAEQKSANDPASSPFAHTASV
jgi:guanine nucleotide exchange protein RalF